jgi:hypothetical protein
VDEEKFRVGGQERHKVATLQRVTRHRDPLTLCLDGNTPRDSFRWPLFCPPNAQLRPRRTVRVRAKWTGTARTRTQVPPFVMPSGDPGLVCPRSRYLNPSARDRGQRCSAPQYHCLSVSRCVQESNCARVQESTSQRWRRLLENLVSAPNSGGRFNCSPASRSGLTKWSCLPTASPVERWLTLCAAGLQQ